MEAALGAAVEIGRPNLAVIRNEISMSEDPIKRRLVLAMVRAARDLRRGMDTLACLDAIFIRVSYGLDWSGNIPDIGK